MFTRDPFRHVGPYGEPRRASSRTRRRLTFAGEAVLAALALAAVLLAVGAIGRAGTYHGMPGRSQTISGTRTWPELVSRAVTEHMHAR
jgi:hypothetical protein